MTEANAEPLHTPVGLTGDEARRRLSESGPNEVAEEPPHPIRSFVRKFWGPVAWMLEAALAIELVLRNLPSSAIILGLLVFNAVVAQVQEGRAQEALRLLRGRLQVSARVLRDGVWSTVSARGLVAGDRIHLRMGDIVPADCRVETGEVEVDQAAITGESATVGRAVGTTLYSSSVLHRGEADATVTATGVRTFYGRTAELVRTARAASHMERLLFRVVRYLVSLDSALALSVLAVAIWRGLAIAEVLPFVLILLIASVPAAMPATFTIANAIESRRMVEEGILVTGLTAVQDAASMDVLCVDKTGTLTEGREAVAEVAGSGEADATTVLALAAAACDASTQDTIDLAILEEARRRGVEPPPRQRFVPFDPDRKRSEAVVTLDGRSVTVALGSPEVLVGAGAAATQARPLLGRLAASGARVLAVTTTTDGGPTLVGFVALGDPPRSDAAELIRSLRTMGVRVLMLTGDTLPTARAVAATVGIGGRFGERTNLAEDPSGYDGFAGIYPEDKFRLVQALQAEGHTVGMTGDGVNDAPALKQAEVGIAVVSATDVARASARLVLTRPGLRDIVSAVDSGRRVYRRMLTWTLNKVSKNFEQVILLTVGFLVAGLFVVSPFLILLLVFANDFVSMTAGTDRTRISSAPDRWDVREIVATAAVVGGCWLALSFSLLAWALGVAHLPIGELQTFFFVYLVFSSQATILVVRERGHAWSSRPATPLLIAVAADVAVVSVLAVSGTLMDSIPAAFVAALLVAVGVTAVAVDTVKFGFVRWTGAFGPSSRLRRRAPAAPGPPDTSFGTSRG